jgi:hypothetical protein
LMKRESDHEISPISDTVLATQRMEIIG